MKFELQKKPYYEVKDSLAQYLGNYGRHSEIPALYEELHSFTDQFPLFDREGKDTLWKTVVYEHIYLEELHKKLSSIYSLLKTGDTKVSDHLNIERIDFCEFGNSRPFRIRVVNQFNDNYDHFYVKVADSNRIYGLELEHILSPNRINYFVNEHTLIEEHIAGIPGDAFIDEYFVRPDLNKVRLAKEFVKFNERSFIRLLGDMRSYNYVVDITPDFDDVQYRVRAIDFDQQSHEGSREMYLPQFQEENKPVVDLCTELLNYPTMQQYQNEERNLVARRVKVARNRLDALYTAMKGCPCSSDEKSAQLAAELGEYHQSDEFKNCHDMADVLKINIKLSLDKAGS